MLVVDCIGNKILTIKTENAFSAVSFKIFIGLLLMVFLFRLDT